MILDYARSFPRLEDNFREERTLAQSLFNRPWQLRGKTGFSHIISEEKARKIGIRAFAIKPLIRKDLARTIRKALGDS